MANKVFQLSKISGKYWWTGSFRFTQLPDECKDYKWVGTIEEVKQLNGTSIPT